MGEAMQELDDDDDDDDDKKKQKAKDDDDKEEDKAKENDEAKAKISNACREEVLQFRIDRNNNINKNIPLGGWSLQLACCLCCHRTQQNHMLCAGVCWSLGVSCALCCCDCIANAEVMCGATARLSWWI